MSVIQTYNFKDNVKGTVFKGIVFQILVNGEPMEDFDQANIKIEFRFGSKYGPKELTLSVGSGLTKVDVPNAKFSVDEFTPPLKPGLWYHDVDITIGEKNYTYIEGTWKILQNV